MKLSTPAHSRNSRFLNLELAQNGQSLPVTVELRRQPRARHMRLRVKTCDRALLTLPWQASYAEAESFLKQNTSWLAEHLLAQPAADALVHHMLEHRSVTGRGRRLELKFIDVPGSPKSIIKTDWEACAVHVHSALKIEMVQAVEWLLILKAIAKNHLDLRVCDLAERVGLTIPPVSVRDQESRWGSCSSSGRLSLNWRLILLPPELQDYVIYHELAHLTEHNHSSRFWDLLHTYDPRAGRHDATLSRDWSHLMRMGRT